MKVYMTRDKVGSLYAWLNKPVKDEDFTQCWQAVDGLEYSDVSWLVRGSDEFKSVRWEDEEPTEVEITIRFANAKKESNDKGKYPRGC